MRLLYLTNLGYIVSFITVLLEEGTWRHIVRSCHGGLDQKTRLTSFKDVNKRSIRSRSRPLRRRLLNFQADVL